MLTSSQDGILVMAHSSAAISKFGGLVQCSARDVTVFYGLLVETPHIIRQARTSHPLLSQSIRLWSQGSTVHGPQRLADDRTARVGHPHAVVICPAVQLSTVTVLIEEGDQAGEERPLRAQPGPTLTIQRLVARSDATLRRQIFWDPFARDGTRPE